MSETVLAGGFFTLFGLLFVGIGLAAAGRNRSFERRGVRVPGVVVEPRRHWTGGSRGGWAYHPVLRFGLADGRPATVESFFGTNPTRWRPGQHVTVVYDPDDPARALADEPGRGSLARYWLLGLVGGAFTLLGMVLALTG